ncbi:hypothetical protein J7E91_22455 [Streptomyces sp. ISL-99]|uniref:hypothetical protein n=1 Tax=Streptomyces sp. ISL-99 TaxID=2819193 RepID=UPI001BE9036B|nr:hypothetical protein [Streptomyces sp. ISL-99]MBT2528101.1 hypothetical protein [Streptomyces sp. ISL-99]
MKDCIARIFEPLSRFLFPLHGEGGAQQRARRRALWLAVHGVDVGPRLIHGVEVAA